MILSAALAVSAGLAMAPPANSPAESPANSPTTAPDAQATSRPGVEISAQQTDQQTNQRADPQLLGDWTERLSATSYAEREQAEQDLLAAALANESVAAVARELSESADDVEVRSRATAVLEQFQRRHALGPSRISMSVRNVDPLKAARGFVQACEAVDIRIEDQISRQEHLLSNLPAEVTLELDNVPFHEAVLELQRKTQLAVRWNGSRLSLQPNWNRQESGVLAPIDDSVGSMGVMLQSAARSFSSNAQFEPDAGQNIAVDQSGGGHSLRVMFSTVLEPKVHVASGGDLVIETATADDGTSLLLPQDDNQRQHIYSGGNQPSIRHTFMLDGDASLGKATLKDLAGYVQIDVADRVETGVFDLDVDDETNFLTEEGTEVDMDQSLAMREHNLRVTKISSTNHELQIEFEVRPPADAQDNVYRWAQTAMKGLSLALPDRLAVQNESLSPQRFHNDDGEQRVEMRLTANLTSPDGEPRLRGDEIRLRWEQPVSIVPVKVPFEFHDVPLPASP